MEKEGENIPLFSEDIDKIKKILSEKRFEDFKINKYYFRGKFTGVIEEDPRHGISLEELKKIFENKQQIKRGFKRKTKQGFLYTLCYEENKNSFVKIGYILNNSLEIFSAIRIYRNLENAVKIKYKLSIN